MVNLGVVHKHCSVSKPRMFHINPSGTGPAKWVRVVVRSPDRACTFEPAFAINYANAQELAPMYGDAMVNLGVLHKDCSLRVIAGVGRCVH